MNRIEVQCSKCKETRTIGAKDAKRRLKANGHTDCRKCASLKPLPEVINNSKVIKDLGVVQFEGYAKRLAVFECQYCHKEFKARVNDITTKKQEGCMCRTGYKSDGKKNNPQLYMVWEAMRGRCNNPKNKSYHNYGGRGITIEPAWDDFNVFRDWAHANGYTPGINLSIDREDNNGNYESSNCRWTTPNVQAANKRYGLKTTKTNAIGVFPNGLKFYYAITYLGNTYYKGNFNTVEEAVEARKAFILLKGFPHTLERTEV